MAAPVLYRVTETGGKLTGAKNALLSMFKLVRWVVGTLLLVSGLLQLLGLPGDIPTWLSLRSRLGWRTVLSVAMMLLGLALMIGVKHFLDHLIFRRRAVTSWQEVGLEGKWREKQWEKQAREKLRQEERESRRD